MVFLRRETRPKVGFNVLTLMNHETTEGQVGIEVEVEGNKFPKHIYPGQNPVNPEKIPAVWRSVKDGSLRGVDNQEYVLKQPLPFDDIPKAVADLWKMFDDFGTVLTDSNRTSVHVHVNVQSWHLNRLTTFMGMYYILEEILTEWCGDNRVGNLFCLRAKDAPALIQHTRKFLQSDGKGYGFSGNIHHYAGLNTHALNKYGSLEFRTLRGVLSPEPIVEWVKIIRRLYELSAEYPDPRMMVESFSGEGPLGFFDFLLGDMAYVVRQGIQMTDYQIRESMYEGIRLAQDICYCRDWSMYEPLKLEEDPFGRERKIVMRNLSSQLDADVAPAGSPQPVGHQTYATEDDFEPEPDYDVDY